MKSEGDEYDRFVGVPGLDGGEKRKDFVDQVFTRGSGLSEPEFLRRRPLLYVWRSFVGVDGGVLDATTSNWRDRYASEFIVENDDGDDELDVERRRRRLVKSSES